jgi:hypothetical protein
VPIESDEGTDEGTEPADLLRRLGDLDRPAAGRHQHLLQRDEIIPRELLVAAEPLQGDVVLMLPEVRGRIGPEALEVGTRCDARKVDRAGVAELILEVGVDGTPPGLQSRATTVLPVGS